MQDHDETPKPKRPLTPMMATFVSEYRSNGGNGLQAATVAGYSHPEVQAYQLLRHPSIVRELEASYSTARQKVAITMGDAAGTAEWVISKAIEVVNRCLEGEKIDSRGANGALSILARLHPQFSEKHDLNVDMRLQAISLVADMTTDELRSLISGEHS